MTMTHTTDLSQRSESRNHRKMTDQKTFSELSKKLNFTFAQFLKIRESKIISQDIHGPYPPGPSNFFYKIEKKYRVFSEK